MAGNPVLAYRMIRTAQRLAGVNAGSGRPAFCDLRRATSTAYYAVFHQITRHAALQVVSGATEEDITLATRWITHGNVASACRTVESAHASSRGTKVPRDETARVGILLGGQAAIQPSLLQLTRRFLILQKDRHRADYDNSYEPQKAVTVAQVEAAQQALSHAWRLWSPDAKQPARVCAHEQYARFLFLTFLTASSTKPR